MMQSFIDHSKREIFGPDIRKIRLHIYRPVRTHSKILEILEARDNKKGCTAYIPHRSRRATSHRLFYTTLSL